MTNQDSKKFEHTNHRRPAKNMIILEKRKKKKRERERERERERRWRPKRHETHIEYIFHEFCNQDLNKQQTRKWID